ncbi:MAG: type II toxin-antitoxin system RelE/ParE family toxin [Caulobacteraceae bacterium]
MSNKAAILRQRARQDIDGAIDYYLVEAGERVALGFIDALEEALRAVERDPAAGSPRYAHELSLPGLRSRILRRYPYLVFYVERDEVVDVWRVLHAARDIAAWLRGERDA